MTWQRPDLGEPCSYPELSRPECRMSQNGPCAQSASQAGPLYVCSQKSQSDSNSVCSTSKNSWLRTNRR